MGPGEGKDVKALTEKAEEFAKQGLIDETSNLKNIKTFSWVGKNDYIIPPQVVTWWNDFLSYYKDDHKYIDDLDCSHTYSTDDQGWEKNDIISPFVNNCEYPTAYESLKWVYSSSIKNARDGFKYENIYKIDQNKYNHIAGCMGDTGFAYVPLKCQSEGSNCPVHVFIHGCLQTYDHVQLEFYSNSHMLDLAEANDFIVLMPVAVKSITEVYNPQGCWDWWGYCDNDPVNFATKQGAQPKAIMSMVHDLQDGKLALTHATEQTMKFTKSLNNRFFIEEKEDYLFFPSDL